MQGEGHDANIVKDVMGHGDKDIEELIHLSGPNVTILPFRKATMVDDICEALKFYHKYDWLPEDVFLERFISHTIPPCKLIDLVKGVQTFCESSDVNLKDIL